MELALWLLVPSCLGSVSSWAQVTARRFGYEAVSSLHGTVGGPTEGLRWSQGLSPLPLASKLHDGGPHVPRGQTDVPKDMQ